MKFSNILAIAAAASMAAGVASAQSRDQIRIALGIALAKFWGAHVPATIPVDVTPIDQKAAGTFSW